MASAYTRTPALPSENGENRRTRLMNLDESSSMFGTAPLGVNVDMGDDSTADGVSSLWNVCGDLLRENANIRDVER